MKEVTLCHGYSPYYYNSKRMGEVDFVVGASRPLPIEVKSGKDYVRHNALENLLKCKEYEIEQAYVLCNGNINQKGKILYLPIYMTMFMRPSGEEDTIYKIDLTGLQ